MSPKFRGGSDDWLDDESSSGPKKKKSKQSPQKQRAENIEASGSEGDRQIEWDEGNAWVTSVHPKLCRVLTDAGEEMLCSYRRAEVYDRFKTERTPVTVGDRVLVSKDEVVEAVCVRKNKLSRPAPGHELKAFDDQILSHVIAANLDLLAIVVSAKDPEFSQGVVDRFLVAAQVEAIPAILCVTKVDLWSGPPPWDVYREKCGIKVYELPSPGTEKELRASILGKRVVFCGHSGVGKTTLLSRLTHRNIGKVGDVNKLTKKGRHTTTGATLVFSEDKSFWVDTPGVREFKLTLPSPGDLRKYFNELSQMGCDPGCLHREELDCKAKESPRYPSYRRILESLFVGEG